jgi:hypothetical protein
MSKKQTPAIDRDADREHRSQAALAALDRSIAKEQEFDAARRRRSSTSWRRGYRKLATRKGASDGR